MFEYHGEKTAVGGRTERQVSSGKTDRSVGPLIPIRNL